MIPFHFPDQRPDEKVLMVIRKHFIVFARLIAAFVLIFVLPSWLLYWAMTRFSPVANNTEVLLHFGVFASMYLLYGLLFLAIAWINEEFDVIILTNQRLIDITQIHFFKRTVASTPLNQIQDSTSSVEGVIPTLLNYGNIDVKTAAGDASHFFMDRIPEPSMVARFILAKVQESRH